LRPRERKGGDRQDEKRERMAATSYQACGLHVETVKKKGDGDQMGPLRKKRGRVAKAKKSPSPREVLSTGNVRQFIWGGQTSKNSPSGMGAPLEKTQLAERWGGEGTSKRGRPYWGTTLWGGMGRLALRGGGGGGGAFIKRSGTGRGGGRGTTGWRNQQGVRSRAITRQRI